MVGGFMMKRESIVCGQHSKNFLNGVASQLMFLEVEVGSSEARSGIYTPRRLGALRERVVVGNGKSKFDDSQSMGYTFSLTTRLTTSRVRSGSLQHQWETSG